MRMKVYFIGSFVLFYIISMVTSLPANQTDTWPCQRDRRVRHRLSEALATSLILSDKISVLRSNMSSRWPRNSFNSSNIHFYGPTRRTVVKPQQVLDENIRVLKAFILLTMNSIKQLSQLQLGGKLVIRNGMNGIVRLANALVQQHLPRILNEMKSPGGKRLSGGRQMKNPNIKPQTPPASTKPSNITSIQGSLTVQEFGFRTQLILTDFWTNVFDLAKDLRNIQKQSCY